MTRYSIVGGGPAGSITLLSEEADPPYTRKELDQVLTGTVSESQLPFFPLPWYAEQGINLRLNTRVERVLPSDRLLVLGDSTRVAYEALLLAPGAVPVRPSWEGSQLSGVMTLRNWADTRTVARHLPGLGQRVVVLGGGLLGLTLAEGLGHLGFKVEILEKGMHLWPSWLDKPASDILLAAAAERGVHVSCDEFVVGAQGTEGRLREVFTSNNRLIETRLVLVATGVKPALTFLDGSGIRVDQGILIDHEFRTNIPEIYAAGDAAQSYNPESGFFQVVTNWKNAEEQGAWAGVSMTGGLVNFSRAMASHAERIFGVPLSVLGRMETTGRADRVLIGTDRRRGWYRKFVVGADRIVGAMFMGNLTGEGMVRHLMKEGRKMPVADIRSTLLASMVTEERALA